MSTARCMLVKSSLMCIYLNVNFTFANIQLFKTLFIQRRPLIMKKLQVLTLVAALALGV